MKFSQHSDDLKVIRLLMKLMQIWPTAKTTLWTKWYFISYVVTGSFVTFLEVLFIILEMGHEDPLALLQVLTDAMATAGFVYKAVFYRHHAKTIRNFLQGLNSRFSTLEVNHDAVKLKIPTWAPVAFTVSLASAAVLTSIAALWEKPETRQLSFKAPVIWNSRHVTFYPTVVLWIWSLLGLASSDALFNVFILVFSSIVREKAETLQNIIRDLDNITDEERRDIELNNIIKYHALLIDIHGLVQRLISGPMLLQFLFLMVGIGTPTLRILLGANIEFTYVIFLLFYIFWIISMLLAYFLQFDAATTAASNIALVAYSSYCPGMTKSHVGKLCLVIRKAQRPMHFTARNFVQLNRRTMLQLIKRSYSIYSAVLKLR